MCVRVAITCILHLPSPFIRTFVFPLTRLLYVFTVFIPTLLLFLHTKPLQCKIVMKAAQGEFLTVSEYKYKI